MAAGQHKAFDIDEPVYDQSTFYGRYRHFLSRTNALLLLTSSKKLEETAKIVQNAREGRIPPGMSHDELRKAKVLYDSAFHPDSGEKMVWLGRMSAQLPAGMVIIGTMLAFYKTPLEVITVQWINQSFNALVNYTNRNAKSEITGKQILQAYLGASTAATVVAVSLNAVVKRAPPIVARWVPFVAVAAANCTNIPLMRQRELIDGVMVHDEQGRELTYSKQAAMTGISQVCMSRITMVAPGMIIVPIIVQQLEKNPFFRRGRLFSAVLQTAIVGLFWGAMVPVGCGLFPQRSSIAFNDLEPKAQAEIVRIRGYIPERVYFNKGL